MAVGDTSVPHDLPQELSQRSQTAIVRLRLRAANVAVPQRRSFPDKPWK
jgi:hypothetical protein